MTLVHHDGRDYQQAASEAAKHFRDKLEKVIEGGRESAAALIEKVQAEVPHDFVQPTSTTGFIHLQKTVGIGINGQRNGKNYTRHFPLHSNALNQACERAGLPTKYAHDLLEREGEWGTELLARNLSTLYARDPAKKILLRVVGDFDVPTTVSVRGVLSDRYRRLDSRPIVEAFAKAAGDIGAVPVEGVGGDTRVALKAVLPYVFEPLPNEVLAFGVQLANSDFGNGALSIRVFWLRLWCTNFATMDESLREIHLGRRLTEDMEFSQETYKLDTATMASAVGDVIRGSLSPEKVNATLDVVKAAAARSIGKTTFADIQKKFGLLKGEVEAAKAVLDARNNEEAPVAAGMYSLSNAIAWVAKKAALPERRLELEQVAGAVLLEAA